MKSATVSTVAAHVPAVGCDVVEGVNHDLIVTARAAADHVFALLGVGEIPVYGEAVDEVVDRTAVEYVSALTPLIVSLPKPR